MFPLQVIKLKREIFLKCWGLVTALLLADLNLATAQTATQPFFVHLWQAEDGLPQSAIPAVLQTSDGFLWVCTYGGLARFDGQHFEVFNTLNSPGLVNSRVTCLFEDTDGSLLIGHETGNLTRYKNGKFQPMNFHASWQNRAIDFINTDEHGDIWLQDANQQLARLKDGKVLTSPNGGLFNFGALTKDDQGRLWVMNAGKVSVMKDGKLTPVDFDGVTSSTTIQGIARSERGGIWVACQGRLRRWDNEHWVEDLGPSPWGNGILAVLLEMKDGYLAAATYDQVGQGLYLISPRGDVHLFNRTNELSSDWIRCLYEDREGNLWAGSGNSGLAMIRHSEITTINPPDNWQGRGVLSICLGKNNKLWFGTEGAGIYELQAGEWKHYDEQEGLSNMYVWSVMEDAQGKLWAGTWGFGLYAGENDRFEAVAATSGFRVTAILPGKVGDLWIGTGSGLMNLQKNGLITRPVGKNESGGSQVRAILEDGTNKLWFGTSGDGLECFENGGLRRFTQRNGLSSDFINCLYLDPGGVLWIGTAGGGIDRLKDGRFSAVTTQQGLPNNDICDIECDDHGYFWISTGGGIVRISKESLTAGIEDRVPSLDCRIYDRGDGLPSIGGSGGFQPAGCQTADHHLWFPTSRGLVVIDPDDVKTNLLLPPVVIEQVNLDGSQIAPAGMSEPLRIPPGYHRLEFYFAGLSFVAPEKVRFKFKLEGLEKDWTSADTMRSAAFNDVPPGKYIFHVIACNNDGIWNETGATFSFVILPHFWQTLWFKILVWFGGVLFVGCGVWLDTRRRMHHKLEHAESLHAIERERNRIAMDLHDHFGARLTQITYLCQIIRKKINEPDLATLSLDHLHTTVRKVTREMDEIVWAVNPQHDTLDSLASYFGRFAQEFLQPAGIRCRLNFPLQLPAWRLTAEIRHNLFLSFKEALNNVAKHANASQVDITLTAMLDGFELIVEDNGRGVDVESLAAGASPHPDRLSPGNGLAGMQRRQTDIGGHFSISSELGKGTKVVFIIKLKDISSI
ncbi:MAG TPA: two-component regulator propeller domain-containing protein [Verrucomicrobiae bacterium]|jgi:signal transduction histidine kinase/ligand-binding sensor domain-containing protein